MLHLTHKKVNMLVNWKNAFWLQFYVKVAAQLPYNWLFN